jgi:PPOX class probable F420-dependent enzyme
MEITDLSGDNHLPVAEWDSVAAGFADITQAPGTGGPDRHTCWLATLNPDGSPHVTAVGAQWHDGTWWFETGPGTRKGRNVARDPRCSLSVATGGADITVQGDARRVTDASQVAELARTWAAGGWPCEVDDTGIALTAPFTAPSGGPPPWYVYRIEPRTAFGLTMDPAGATRWTF